MARRIVNFDGKNWVGKRPIGGPLKIHSYRHVAKLASKALGPGGIVGIPNARPKEMRYEDFFRTAKFESAAIEPIDDGRAFYDSDRYIYFLKTQEVKTKHEGASLRLLVYNLPFDKNLEDRNLDQVLQDASELNCIVGVTGPHCVGGLYQLRNESTRSLSWLLGHLDFFVGYSGSAALGGANGDSMDFYDKHIRNRKFRHPITKEDHKVGITSVSGGHRTPKGFWGSLFNGGQTIGTSNAEIPAPSGANFMSDLRGSLRESKYEGLNMNPIHVETIRHGISMKLIDPIKDRIKGWMGIGQSGDKKT